MRYFISILGLMVLGCQSDRSDVSVLYSKIDSLTKENDKLQEITRVIDSANQTPSDTLSEGHIVTFNATEKYCFVLLTVDQIEPVWGKKETYFYCTSIQEYPFVNDESNYRLMDEAQQSYLDSWAAVGSKGRIKDRQCFVFDSYSEASKEREKYLVNK